MRNIGSDILNHFDLPKDLLQIQGSFKYRFFDFLEQVEEDSYHAKNDLDVPRYIKIEWTGENELQELPGLSDNKVVHKENFFFASDLNKGYSTLVTDEKESKQRQDNIISDSSEGSKLEYLLSQVASNEYTENIEEFVSDGTQTSNIPVLDETSNTPVSLTTVFDNSSQPDDIVVRSANVFSILQSSVRSPLSCNLFDSLLETASAISEKELAGCRW